MGTKIILNSSGGNISTADLTFDAAHTANINGYGWQLKDSTGANRILFDIQQGFGSTHGIGYGGAAIANQHTFYNIGGTNQLCSFTNLNGLKLTGDNGDYLNFGSAGFLLTVKPSTAYGASISVYPNIILKTNHSSQGVIFDTNNFVSFKKATVQHSLIDSSSRWILRGSAVVGSEKISLQDDTLIKGSDNSVNTSGFKFTDINNNLLLDIRNNGQTGWGGNKVINVAHAFYNSGGGSSSLARFYETDGTIGINLATNGTIMTANSSQGTIFSTNAQGGVPHIRLFHQTRGEIIDLQSGASHIDATSLTLGGQTGKPGAKVSIMQASAVVNQQLFFGNITTHTAGRLGSDTGFGTNHKGLECFDTTANKKYVWNGTAWEKIKGNIESVSVASATTVTPNIDISEMEIVSALASALTIAVPTGVASSFYEGKELTFRIKDNGTARALTWNAIFVDYTGILPTTTVASKTVYIGCKYNVVDTKWDVVAVQVQP